jgi:hypothetical protein
MKKPALFGLVFLGLVACSDVPSPVGPALAPTQSPTTRE